VGFITGLDAVICGVKLDAVICGVELFFSATYDATSEATLGLGGVGLGPRRRDPWRRDVIPRRRDAWRRPPGSKTEIKFSRVKKVFFFKKKVKL
jgi:hypothetical protein